MRCLRQNSHSKFADIVTYQQQRGYFHLLPFPQNCDTAGLKKKWKPSECRLGGPVKVREQINANTEIVFILKVSLGPASCKLHFFFLFFFFFLNVMKFLLGPKNYVLH